MPSAPGPRRSALAEIDEAVAVLLFDRRARARASRDGPAALASTPRARAALATLDLGQIENIAHAVREGVARGTYGGGGILTHYPQTLDALRSSRTAAEDVVDDFLGSDLMGQVDCVGMQQGSMTVTEAFYHWARPQLPSGSRATGQHEFAAAMVRLLAPARSGRVPVRSWLVHSVPAGHVAVLDRANVLTDVDTQPRGPVLYAACGGRVQAGNVRPVVAATILRESQRRPAWVEPVLAQHKDHLEEVTRQLTARGLL